MDHPELFCKDLPSKSSSPIGRILVTGASGYVGSRLVTELIARGYKVRLMVRGKAEVYKKRWREAEVGVADAFNVDHLRAVLQGIDAAYYLIHSLNLGPTDFESADEKAAVNFKTAAEENGVNRLIYLGGLGDVGSRLSHHLGSRTDVAIRLMMGRLPVTTIRAAIIIGSGGSSYEIIHHLVKNLPVIVPPPWAKTKCQPIALRDLIKYLVGVLETPEASEGFFDAGGRDILTYEDMLKIFAKIMNKKILFVPSPFNCISFYSQVASLITPSSYAVIRCLFESLQNEVVCQDDQIRRLVPFEPMSYKESILEAFTQEKQAASRTSEGLHAAHV